MKKYIISVLLLFISYHHPSYSQIKTPAEPRSPELIFKSSAVEKRYSYPVIINFHGKKGARGRLYFHDNKLLIPLPKNSEKKSFTVQISNIKSIEFIEWEMKEYKKNSFLFYPVMTRVDLEGSYYICHQNIPELNKISFIREDKDNQEGVIYSIFYDYLKNNSWVIMKSNHLEYPKKNPHKDALVKIEFVREKEDNRDFFNIFKK